jgi:hypothetical protein
MGFITYHGMTAEQFLWVWLRSELLEPKQLHCEPVNYYYEVLKPCITAWEREAYKSHDEKH